MVMFRSGALKGISLILGIVAMVHLLGFEAFCSATYVIVPNEVRVKGDKVTLGQIARIRCDDANTTRRLKEIVIADAPGPDKTLTLSREDILRTFKAYPELSREIRWKLPEKVVILSHQVLVKKEKIIQWVTKAVLSKIHWPKDRVKVQFLSQAQDVLLPRGKIAHEIIFPRKGLNQRIVPIQIVFRVDGQIRKRICVNTRIDLYQPVVVAARPMAKGTIIRSHDVRMELGAMSNSQHPMMTDLNQAVGKKTKRAIFFSQPLGANLLEAPPIVSPGKIVRLVAEIGLLRVTTIAKVREKAGAGEAVRVMNLASKKVVYGYVVDHRTVQVEF